MALTQAVAFLFSFCLIVTKGSKEKQLFVQTESELTLDTVDPNALEEDYIALRWTFNTSDVLVSAPKNGQAKINNKRVMYHSQNSSLTVKDLQEEHSGLYLAVLITHTGSPTISSYSITVQAPVSEVSLRVDSVSLSSESCNVTVSCTTESSSINASFTCNNHSCEKPHPLRPDPALSLRLYLSNMSVICNHSNHVSWKNETKNISQVCQQPDPPEPIHETNLAIAVGVPVSILSALLVLGVLWWKRPKKGGTEETETIYADPEGPSPQPAPATEMTENPTSTYSLVGQHSGPAPTGAPTQTRVPDLVPESLYATVNKPQSNPYSLAP